MPSRRYKPASLHKLKPVAKVEPKVVEVMRYRHGAHFGERALSRTGEERADTITCTTDVTVLRLSAATFLQLKQQQDHKENLLRRVVLFETFVDDQIAASLGLRDAELRCLEELERGVDVQPRQQHGLLPSKGLSSPTLWLH